MDAKANKPGPRIVQAHRVKEALEGLPVGKVKRIQITMCDRYGYTLETWYRKLRGLSVFCIAEQEELATLTTWSVEELFPSDTKTTT